MDKRERQAGNTLGSDRARRFEADAWRPFLAGAVIALGGSVAVVLGLVQETLLNVTGTLGLTLFVAGIVDGSGRYRGAGITLLLVFASAKVISRAPAPFRAGAGYGVLVALYGVSVLVRRWPRSRT